MSKPKPKVKRKVVGYKTVVKKSAPVQQGSLSVGIGINKGSERREYKPTSAETGHPAYGKPGGGTNSEMNSLLAEARKNKQDITKSSSKGLTYKAGETKITKKPDTVSINVDHKPHIPSPVRSEQVPVYEKSKQSSGNLKPRQITMGGDVGGRPANISGVGKGKKIVVRRIKKF